MKAAGILLAICVGAGAGGRALADTIVLRNGGVRQGTILSRDDTQVTLQIMSDGIEGKIVIPMSQIARITIGPDGRVPERPVTSAPSLPPSNNTLATSAPASPAPPPHPTVEELAVYRSGGFFVEIVNSASGRGPDDLDRLPAAQRDLWKRAVACEVDGSRAQTLDALRSLEFAMRDLPEGSDRLDAVCRRERQESFGTWMGRIHWDIIASQYRTGQYDLADVRDIERAVMIGLLKEKTGPALEALKPYSPPLDEKTGLPQPFRPAQLQGITANNALEVKDKAMLAAAVLLAQLRLEPDMPAVDRALLGQQLGTVNRILSRARELEPAAKMALARAEQERKASEEKARHDAAINARKALMTPK